jgi:DNA replicative helicase MCM subunit Mcm2 (Cdc46/Mcm family)
LKESNVKKATPGDIILVQGILLPQKKLGFRHQGDLTFECHIEALKIIREKKKYIEMSLNEEQINEI